MGASLAIFSAVYPPHLGGVEAFTQGLARALVSRGDEATVVTNDTEGLGTGLSDEGGVSVLRLPCRPLLGGRFPVARGAAARRALAELDGRDFDGVLVNTRFYPHSLLGMAFARERGLAPVVLDHGSAYLTFGSPALDMAVRAYEHAVTRWGRRYHGRYFGISEKSAAWLGTFGLRADGVITNAIDAASYRASASGRDLRSELGVGPGQLLVAFVGRLIPEKGVRALVEASRDERLAGAGVVLALAGDGPLAPEVAAAEGACLRALGRLSREDTAALLSQANLLCLPTRSEGFSTTLLEAAACGCPALVTDVGGARELIPDDSFGRIMPDASSETIVRELLALAARASELPAMGRRCQERAEGLFSWDATAAAVERACATLRS